MTAADGRILIAQRPAGKHLAGGWEFPGGKLEPGEVRAAGLARELAEELGIVIHHPRPLIRVRHAYPEREVLIDLWVVTRYDGTPRGLDGQALQWLTQEQLERAELLPADRPIVRALRLPERLTEAHSDHYEIDTAHVAGRQTLHGTSVGSIAAALRAAAQGGTDFLALHVAIADRDLERLCAAIDIPVYARMDALEPAWAMGATGVSLLNPPKS